MPHFDALKICCYTENIVRKGEIACNKQFLLFSQCFLPYRALIFHLKCTLTHYQMTNFTFSKLKEFADNDFKFDENGRKLSKRVENSVGKGEIARYEQFLLFPQFFEKACFPGASKGVIVWEWVKMSSAICFDLDQSKILSSGNGFKYG